MSKNFEVTVKTDGKLIMTPLETIPERELWVYKSPKSLAALEKGIQQVGKGKVRKRGSFAKYIKDEI